MYAACMTKPKGSSRCTLTFHWCTVGSFSFGSNAVIEGALLLSCSGGVRNDEGLIEGGGRACGKPPLIVWFGTAVHPFVVVPPTVEEQVVRKPGTLPATAVAWKELTGSNARP